MHDNGQTNTKMKYIVNGLLVEGVRKDHSKDQ